MAIFGSLSDISFDELLYVLSGKEGVLEMKDKENRLVKLFIKDNCIQALEFNGKYMDDRNLAIVTLMDFVKNEDVSFTFIRTEVDDTYNIKLQVDELLLEIASKFDEISYYRNFLPHEDTVFKLSREDVSIEDRELEQFLEKTKEMFRKGASAKEVSNKLNLPLDWVKYMIYKLNMLGILEVRKVKRNVRKDIFHELHSLFRKLFGGGA